MAATQDVIERICRIPAELKSRKGARIENLARASRYAQFPYDLDAEAVQVFLEANPELLTDWAEYSAGKPKGEGWYLDAAAARVDFYSGGQRATEETFASPAEACAAFILQEVPWVLYNEPTAPVPVTGDSDGEEN